LDARPRPAYGVERLPRRAGLHPRSLLERRWSSRRFSYGYLVTTSPQSRVTPWAAASLSGQPADF